MNGRMPVHYFTVDVEEYFHVSAFNSLVTMADWHRYPSRAALCMERLLSVLDDHQVRGTFFMLGWLAHRRPALVRMIADAGHEVASHGWGHERVTELSRDAFRLDVRQSKARLEDLCGMAVRGYRAPSFSITRENDWALDVLVEEGYAYDSSLMPVRRPGYGYRGGAADAHWLHRAAGPLLELPPATLDVLGMRVPAGGGAYLRLFPPAMLHAAFRDCDRRGVPGTLYIHPWELDPNQPRMNVPWWTRIRHYGGLAHTERRVRHLLSEFRFAPISSCPELQ
jgi:polysaccharide deacetylase family protein (PEP-CTERM system associated)